MSTEELEQERKKAERERLNKLEEHPGTADAKDVVWLVEQVRSAKAAVALASELQQENGRLAAEAKHQRQLADYVVRQLDQAAVALASEALGRASGETLLEAVQRRHDITERLRQKLETLTASAESLRLQLEARVAEAKRQAGVHFALEVQLTSARRDVRRLEREYDKAHPEAAESRALKEYALNVRARAGHREGETLVDMLERHEATAAAYLAEIAETCGGAGVPPLEAVKMLKAELALLRRIYSAVIGEREAAARRFHGDLEDLASAVSCVRRLDETLVAAVRRAIVSMGDDLTEIAHALGHGVRLAGERLAPAVRSVVAQRDASERELGKLRRAVPRSGVGMSEEMAERVQRIDEDLNRGRGSALKSDVVWLLSQFRLARQWIAKGES